MAPTIPDIIVSLKNDIAKHRKEIWIAEAKIEALNEALWKLEGIE